jgi:hypothetical protein
MTASPGCRPWCVVGSCSRRLDHDGISPPVFDGALAIPDSTWRVVSGEAARGWIALLRRVPIGAVLPVQQ